jgi:hypothetical protein
MSDNELTVFVDGIGRTLIGELVSSNTKILEVKNPAILHVQPNQQTGQISVQLVPFFFKEFLSGGQGHTTWEFVKNTVVVSKDVAIDNRLKEQYNNMFSAIQTPPKPALVGAAAGASTEQPPVVKLFDD